MTRTDRKSCGTYTKIKTEDNACFYCGQRASGYDHFPPLSRRYEFPKIKRVLVPSCAHCNSILGSSCQNSLAERLEVLKSKLLRRKTKYIRAYEILRPDDCRLLKSVLEQRICYYPVGFEWVGEILRDDEDCNPNSGSEDKRLEKAVSNLKPRQEIIPIAQEISSLCDKMDLGVTNRGIMKVDLMGVGEEYLGFTFLPSELEHDVMVAVGSHDGLWAEITHIYSSEGDVICFGSWKFPD